MTNSFKKKKFVFFLVGIIVLVSLNFFQSEVRNFFYLISQPFQKCFNKINQSISDFGGVIFNIKELKQEKEVLLLENQSLKSQLAALKEIENENETIRQALDLNLQEEFALLMVEVTLRDSLHDFILINKGGSHGISKGMSVISGQRILVGRVAEVYDDFSQVMLITSGKSVFPGKIQEGDIGGVIKGLGNSGLFFDLIPQQKQVSAGQQVVTVGLDKVFPKGILVGEIESVQKSDLAPFQQARIKPSFDVQGLETVFVILSVK